MQNIMRMFFCVIMALILPSQIGGGNTQSAKTVLAELINVRSRGDNQWMTAVKDSKTASRWDVAVKQNIPKEETIKDIFVHMYTRNSPNSFQEDLFESNLCNLLTDHTNSQFFPKDIVDMILPGSQGSCAIEKGTYRMQSTRCVDTEYQQNPGIIFPQSTPYELIVDFLSKTLPDDQRLFRVNLIVGQKTDCTYGQSNDNESGHSEDKCRNVAKLFRPACIISQKVTSTISGIGQGIKHLL